VQAIGEKAKQSMKSKIKYTNEPIEGHAINDFLPAPENLILKEKKTKVTLALTEKSLSFFKKAAKEHGASYQAMIRNLLDFYVANQKI